jgi:hypothetical protein
MTMSLALPRARVAANFGNFRPHFTIGDSSANGPRSSENLEPMREVAFGRSLEPLS